MLSTKRGGRSDWVREICTYPSDSNNLDAVAALTGWSALVAGPGIALAAHLEAVVGVEVGGNSAG